MPYHEIITCGYFHTLFVDENEYLHVFGSNKEGQLGLEKSNSHEVLPMKHPFFARGNIKCLGAGAFHSIFATKDNKVYSCGENGFGQLGLGDNINRNIPVEILFFRGMTVKRIVCGHSFTIIFTTSGAFVFGENQYGELGLGHIKGNLYSPFEATSLRNMTKKNEIEDVSSGNDHTVILNKNGQAFSYGDNQKDQLFRRTTSIIDDTTPQIIDSTGMEKIRIVACKNDLTALVSERGVYLSNKQNNRVGSCNHLSTLKSIKYQDIIHLALCVNGSAPELLFTRKSSSNKLYRLKSSNFNIWESTEYLLLSPVLRIYSGDGYFLIVTKDRKLYSLGNNTNKRAGLVTPTTIISPTPLKHRLHFEWDLEEKQERLGFLLEKSYLGTNENFSSIFTT